MIQESMLIMSRMNCSGCAKNITRILQSLPHIEIIATNLPAKTVHLRFDPEQVTMDTIKTVLNTANYPVASEQVIDHTYAE